MSQPSSTTDSEGPPVTSAAASLPSRPAAPRRHLAAANRGITGGKRIARRHRQAPAWRPQARVNLEEISTWIARMPAPAFGFVPG
jgi:hypothetical protein